MKYKLLRKTYDHTTPCGEYDDLTALVNAAVHAAQLRPDAPVFEVETVIVEADAREKRKQGFQTCPYCGCTNRISSLHCLFCKSSLM